MGSGCRDPNKVHYLQGSSCMCGDKQVWRKCTGVYVTTKWDRNNMGKGEEEWDPGGRRVRLMMSESGCQVRTCQLNKYCVSRVSGSVVDSPSHQHREKIKGRGAATLLLPFTSRGISVSGLPARAARCSISEPQKNFSVRHTSKCHTGGKSVWRGFCIFSHFF